MVELNLDWYEKKELDVWYRGESGMWYKKFGSSNPTEVLNYLRGRLNKENEMEVLKEVARLKKECNELGITAQDLCSMVHVKKQLISSWVYRSKDNPAYKPRQSVLLQMNEKLEELRRSKRGEGKATTLPAQTIAPDFDDDDLEPAINQALNRRPSACQVLTEIITDKVRGMSLVQLAMLIGHIEGMNGK